MTVEVPCPGAGHSYLIIISHKHLFHKGIFQKNKIYFSLCEGAVCSFSSAREKEHTAFDDAKSFRTAP